ncbi:hypothetical protein EIN_410320 [Entamoeba invadens IP1]|uniref:TLDc domain-containing protein n=1 Tax=Entamoeba invadens IP1 TaxID=370355 RepID=A0A0A1U2E1_ENTIV|nr:hypothetical protein EIN_410320 [Entamoeba invadens IP1]ELP85693.1 hypothetical protein EIN_410320 [Entamoeba invadens IP1]|eukprot:XP_004185039.1 hypothetical protein EIN_410320 [Entamoeba invadens IP1]
MIGAVSMSVEHELSKIKDKHVRNYLNSIGLTSKANFLSKIELFTSSLSKNVQSELLSLSPKSTDLFPVDKSYFERYSKLKNLSRSRNDDEISKFIGTITKTDLEILASEYFCGTMLSQIVRDCAVMKLLPPDLSKVAAETLCNRMELSIRVQQCLCKKPQSENKETIKVNDVKACDENTCISECMSSLTQWTKTTSAKLLFDTDTAESSVQCLRSEIETHHKIAVLCFASDGTSFGAFFEKVPGDCEIDNSHFIFSVYRNGSRHLKRFSQRKNIKACASFLEKKSNLMVWGNTVGYISLGSLGKEKSICCFLSNTYDCEDEDLTGNNWVAFTIKRVVIIQVS